MKTIPRKPLNGKKFNFLTVIEQAEDYVSPSGKRQIQWLCKCDCGKEKIILGSSLKSGNAKSCTCQKIKLLKKQNKYEVKGKVVFVYFNNCNDKMICDLEDWEKLKQYCWILGKSGYAEARVNGKTRLFHHFVIQSSVGYDRDHINKNKLDNRKGNLRIVSRSINNYNRYNSNKYGVKGVYYKNGKFISRINYKNKRIHLGCFDTIEEAKIAREKAEMVIFKKEGVV